MGGSTDTFGPNLGVDSLVAVVSGASRSGAERFADSLVATLGRQADLQVVIVNSSAEATAVAREAAGVADAVIAVGGDGTVSDVATGILGSPTMLAIVPAGSTNITARTLGIPADPSVAIQTLRGPCEPRWIDAGLSGDRVFLHIAGAGIDAALFGAANPRLKRSLGWLAYLPAAVPALRLSPSRVQVTVDDIQIDVRSSLVLVANGGSVIAPPFTIHPAIAVDDGWLDILIFTACTPSQVIETLGRAATRTLHRSPFVTWRRAKTARIEALPPLPIQLDGDVRGITPREFRIVPRALAVLTPRRY